MLDYVIRRVLIAIPTLLLISFICFIVINLPAGDVITTYEQNLVGNRGWGEEEARIEGGIYSATRQYSVSDNVFTVMSFIGLSMPGFLLALAILVYMTFVLDLPLLTGLYSPEYADAPWSFGRVKDLAAHIWLPVFVGGIPGIASLMRIMRGNLLDELGRQYVETARAKGMAEKIVVIKHAVRVAINPLISLLGMQFPEIVSGGVITAIVLGNLVADLLLAWVDPRVRFD
ncbi:MAG: ABC transporter permease [Caldilineaceae bacterium]|nr:ABC transporter permease [Caldilineaceae bacterium]